MPAYLICTSDSSFTSFINGLHSYIQGLFMPNILDRICVCMNNHSPFVFNVSADTEHTNATMLVFRKGYIHVPVQLLNNCVKQGFLDPNHGMGTPYTLRDRSVLVTDPAPRAPGNWTGGNDLILAKDHRQAGYATTIGAENFHELKSNMMDPKRNIKGAPGRRRKIVTGQRGGVAKAPTLGKQREQREKFPSSLPTPDSSLDNAVKQYDNLQQLAVPLATSINITCRSTPQLPSKAELTPVTIKQNMKRKCASVNVDNGSKRRRL
ncbi:hypothetical protein K435DRAFT_878820 [Dendrothele bispora CBS 962.96]|uniref:Uncharacterized protein n=1 Tax=Dendrothele bispora (strain CBS 962.96) TaxID=1314807 RepID=A0A4S8KMB7_DENBC|nr:hypothetical protein K435DRAFT_878820 [Dendrothele bispora CBS 962.96]